MLVTCIRIDLPILTLLVLTYPLTCQTNCIVILLALPGGIVAFGSQEYGRVAVRAMHRAGPKNMFIFPINN